MKAVILAAGKGTRMGALSEETPKPMQKVLEKPILMRILDALPDEINEAVITVNYLKEQIIDAFGPKYKHIKITYIEQKELLGTAHALWACKEHLINEDKFLVMMGDNIYTKEDLEDCLQNPWALLVEKRSSIKGVAKVVVDDAMNVQDIIERYPNEEEGFTSPGVYALTPDIFNYEMVQWGHGEYGLPQTIVLAKNDRPIKAVVLRFMLIITTPENLKEAEDHFLSLEVETK
ncbi:MAG: dTDP-glucose pyrophosphorylase [Candidatus Taylorbacteria bacterium]|nr:dTDP-glucose pyrophosphorylase [Candidatus Taylorbacteria bacterium]